MTHLTLNPFQTLAAGSTTLLPADDRYGQAAHRWDANEIDALTFAVAAQRPLLVRGEAGCGKSQIARAASRVSESKLFCEVIHPRFEALDLLYRYDVVARLADGQVSRIDETNKKYVKHGALWDAIDAVQSNSALPVLLIDEIDKADSDIPNALLEVLGNRSFQVPHLKDEPSKKSVDGRLRLIVITTNEERELPAAFVRRCAVLNLNPPRDLGAFEEWLIERGSVHAHLDIEPAARRMAAEQVVADREASRAAGYPTVGLAEYIDLLHALHDLTRDARREARPKKQIEWLGRLSRYALVKNPEQDQNRPAVGEPTGDGVKKA